ncbi:MAG TPA: hypothetical protein VK149_09705 [Sideroxyarcus sp.]|nr:hypothetical protein [Sideroxyarcus sp.]
MLGIFGKKSDHPLADLKSAQQVLEDVPKNDALNTVQELTDWIEAIVEQADGFRLDHELAVLRMFDEAAQPHVRKLLRDYFAVQPLSKFQENRLWTVLDNFYTHCEVAYHDVLTRHRNGARGASAVKTELALLSARGIAALTGRLKMAAARYALVETVLWKHLAEFYIHAESSGYGNDTVALYAGIPGATSVKQEFSVLLIWYGVSAGTLSPMQEHLTERLVAHVGRYLTVGKQVTGDVMFVFDAAQPTPPMRASAEFTVHPAMRFAGVGDVMNQLGGLLKTFEKGIVPEEINLCGGKYEADLLRDILRRLIESLTQPLPTRRNPRRKINVNLQVANGFFKMLEQTDVGLNFSQSSEETWEVEDISATGFRSVVPAARADNIKIGSLVGSKPENVSHWGAGVVRRLSRDAKNNLHIGVEVLSPQIVGVSLVDRGNSSDEGHVALYLNRPNDTSGEAWLLMRPDTFSTSRSLDMEMNGKGYLLLPLALVEGGEDYDLARYRRMEQDSSSEV